MGASIKDTKTFELKYPQGVEPLAEPLFILDLLVNDDNTFYSSINLEEVKTLVLKMYDKCMHSIHDTPCIETLIMEFYTVNRTGDIPMIKIVTRGEDAVEERYKQIDESVSRSLTYVDEYISKFKNF